MRPALVLAAVASLLAGCSSGESPESMTVGLVTMLEQGTYQPALYNLVLVGALLSILPLVALFLSLQRYWRIDLMTGVTRG